jgi:hypothetical protein
MPLDEFEEEKLLERFRPILDRERSLADCIEYSDEIAEDIFIDLLYYHPEIKTAAEFTDEQLREYARERIARDLGLSRALETLRIIVTETPTYTILMALRGPNFEAFSARLIPD